MESSAVARYQRFFGAYQQVNQDASDAYRNKIAQFMGQVAPFVQLQKEVRKQTAAHFNLFEALSIARKEQFQSRFLAFLLDPRETHDQGAMFLRTFLEHILSLDMPSQSLDRTKVRTEVEIETYGRVDIHIALPDKRMIVIENKVNTSEGEEQITHYQDWLRSQRLPPYGQHILVFLTPEGRPPQTGDLADILCVSYRQLGDWVSSLPELPERLCMVLTQYGENCRVIGGDRRYGMAMGHKLTDELHAFLTEPSNLDTALEVAESVETIRREVFEQFWRRVKEQLSADLTRHGYQRQWEVWSNFAERYPYCGIYWKHCDVQFAVECYTGTNNYSACYGISRGKEVRVQARDVRDQAISTQLGTEDLVIDEDIWWVGWRYLHDLDLPDFCGEKKEDVLRLNEDNHAPDHPLAHKLASLLWDLFDKHREALEDLNTNYPY